MTPQMKRGTASVRATAAVAVLLLGVGLSARLQAANPVPVTVFYAPGKGVKAHQLAAVSQAMGKELNANHRLVVHDSDKLLADFAGDIPRAEIEQAHHACDEGERLIEHRPEEAVEMLEAGVAALTRLLPFIKKQYLARMTLSLGIAQAEAGHKRAAQRTFVRLLKWRPGHRYVSPPFASRHAALFAAAQQQLERSRKGSIELITEPVGAKAFVDGRFVGITPTVVWGLTVGDHMATFKKTGFIKGGRVVTVSAKMQTQWSAALRRSEKFLLVKQALDSALTGLGKPRATAAMVDLGRVLFVHQLIFVAVHPSPPKTLELHAYLYDLRSKLLLNQVRAVCSPNDPSSVAPVARMLYLDVPYDGSITAPPEPPPPKPVARAPLYTKWWLWTAIAAGAAAGAAAIVLPLALQEESCAAARGCVSIQN